MASSSSSAMQMKDEKPSNWAELPSELTASILLLLSAVEILESAQKVCMPWRRVSKDPSIWQKIDMRNMGDGLIDEDYFGSRCRQAVDRSEGGLVEIRIGNFGSDSLLNYIANRSSNLKILGLDEMFPITNKGLEEAVAKLPLLEELEVSGSWSDLDLKAIGHSCPKLKTLKLNCSGYISDDVDALAIATSMPELRHLQLLGKRLTDTGLNTILENCPHLKYLDLRQCLNISFPGILSNDVF